MLVVGAAVTEQGVSRDPPNPLYVCWARFPGAKFDTGTCGVVHNPNRRRRHSCGDGRRGAATTSVEERREEREPESSVVASKMPISRISKRAKKTARKQTEKRNTNLGGCDAPGGKIQRFSDPAKRYVTATV